MNVMYLVLELLICYITIIFLYKKYQTNGLYSYCIFAFIISSIMSLKTIEVYEFTINLGIIPFISVFTTSNIIIQKRGKEEVKELIITMLITSLISYIIFVLVSKMDSSIINLFTNASYDNIFNQSTRMYFANIVTLLYMLLFNSILYYYLKKEKNKIWISNIFSTIIIHFIATIIFIVLAYAITTEINKIIEMLLIRYALSVIIGIIGTVAIYITNNKIKEK